MGFYRAFPADRSSPGGIEGTITAGEYCRMMATVLGELGDHRRFVRARYRPAVRSLRMGRFPQAVEALAALVRQAPGDRVARQLLGVAHLAQRDLRAAMVHLEAAHGLLKQERAVGRTLRHSLRVRCEEALVRYLLVALYPPLGRREDARRLAAEGEAL